MLLPGLNPNYSLNLHKECLGVDAYLTNMRVWAQPFDVTLLGGGVGVGALGIKGFLLISKIINY